MKKTILSLTAALLIGLGVQAQDKLVSKDGYINFFSHTVLEDISSDNYSVVSTLEPSTGAVVYSVTMQSFEFEKAKMQQHFNSSKFLDTKTFPKAKLKGKITNLGAIDFATNGTYEAMITGELTIHGVTKSISEKGTITVSDGQVQVDAKMKVTLADFEIAFEKGKPSTNVAKEIEVTIKSIYKK